MRRFVSLLLVLIAGSALAPSSTAQEAGSISIGAKNFTESNILAEVIAQLIEARTDLTVERKYNLGGSTVCWEALRAGSIDLYVEYTGTAWAVLLGETSKTTDPLETFEVCRARCRRKFDVHWLMPFGFENTYALTMLESRAEEFDVRRISDLARVAGSLEAGFGVEFAEREDGYKGLAKTYGLEFGELKTIEHGLAYTALVGKQIDVIDAYSTDGKLARYPVRVLEDDLRFFPPYHAAPLVRGETLRRVPELRDLIEELGFRIDAEEARAMNAHVEDDGATFEVAARTYLESEGLLDASSRTESAPGLLDSLFREENAQRVRALFGQILSHLQLTAIAVLLASLVAIPIGVVATRHRGVERVSLGIAGVLQTVPSLALLAFFIPVLGLGALTAIVALFLYALLPILRNTYTGIREVDTDLVDAAVGLGLTPWQVLSRVELPLAARTILAGIRTSTVIGIGVATLAAFVGAGGLGEPIVNGLYLNDPTLVLFGAIPAALLALSADALLSAIERRIGVAR